MFPKTLTPKPFRLGLMCRILFLTLIISGKVCAYGFDPHSDTTVPGELPYPIHDTRGDFLTNSHRTLDLNNPSNLTDSIAYDPETRKYIVFEKIGSRYYRTPTWYTFDEFMQIQAKKQETNILKNGQIL